MHFHVGMQVRSKAEKLDVSINFLGRKDHLDPALQDYQVSKTCNCASLHCA